MGFLEILGDFLDCLEFQTAFERGPQDQELILNEFLTFRASALGFLKDYIEAS